MSASAADLADSATLLVRCPDRRGILASMAQSLSGHSANILAADQYRDSLEGQFFQRIHFDGSELQADWSSLERGIAEVADRFDMEWTISRSGRPLRVAIFVSKYDHCLWDLLLRHSSGELPCEISLINSNRPDLLEQFGIPYRVFPISRETKVAQEEAEITLIEEREIDLIVLARYMQILSKEFTDDFPARVINIHHSFRPAFSGGKPYHQAAARDVKLIEATAHYVTSYLDEGPIIEQVVVRTSHRDSVAELIRKGRDVERSVLARAVRWNLEERNIVCGNKTPSSLNNVAPATPVE